MADFFFIDGRSGGPKSLSAAIASPDPYKYTFVDWVSGRLTPIAEALANPWRIGILDALNGGVVQFARAAGILPKYPNFPQITLLDPNIPGGFTTQGSGSFTNNSDPAFTDGRKIASVTCNNNDNYIKSNIFTPVDVRKGHISGFLRIVGFDANKIDPSGVQIRIYSNGSPAARPSNYHVWGNRTGIQQNFAGGPFIKVGANPADFLAVGGGADLSAITWVEWHFRSWLSTDFVTYDTSAVQFVPNPRKRGALIIREDDAWKRPALRDYLASIGAPWFQAPGAIAGPNGFNGAGYNTPPTNNPDRWSIAEADAMRATGVQIGTQAWSTESTLADYAAYLAEFQGMQAYYRARGWMADAADGTYYSSVNIGTPGARRAMLETGTRSIQRFTNGRNNVVPGMETRETFPFRDETSITAINLAAPGIGADAPTITDSIKNELDRIVATNDVLILAGHQDIVDQPAEWAALTYAGDRWVQGGRTEFDILTPSMLLDPWMGVYGTRDYPAPVY